MWSKGVLELSYEFIITLVVMIGGGFLIARGVEVTTVTTFIGICMTFWFTGRKTLTGVFGNAKTDGTDTNAQTPAETPAAAPTTGTSPVPTPFDVTKK